MKREINHIKESKVEKHICKYATTLGWLTYKFVSPGKRGVPDRIFLRDGLCIFIEFKATNKSPTRVQSRRLGEIKYAGFAARWINTIEAGISFFQQFEDL